MACSLCQQLQPKVCASTGTCTLNVSVRLLRLTDSAAAGCSFGGMIREGIDCYKHRLEGMDRIIEHAIIVRFLMIDHSLSKSDTKLSHHLAVELTWGSKKDGDGGGIGADWHFTADLKLYFMTSNAAAVSLQEECADLVATFLGRQLDVCSVEHNTKCDNSPPAHLPDRVIKIDPDAAVMPKIVENVEEDSDYIALSHCWGSRKGPLRTLLANLQDHKNAITLDQDSNTLRDAIQITRALHISYLWIDSLCIIQEDPADWVVQSAKMATIYANARLTISAASAPEAEGGILAERSEPYRLNRPLASRESITVWVQEQPSHDVFRGQFNEESNLNGWMLNEEMQEPSYEGLPHFTRAWACQERLLSPRILHFTPSEMIFECGSGFHCECNRISDETYDPRKLTSLRTDYLATVASIKNASDIQDQLETTSVVDDQSTTSVEYRPHIRKKDTVLRWVWNFLLEKSLKRILNPITFIELDAFIQELIQSSYPIDERSVNTSRYNTDAERVWLRIITEITTKALTYERDRLPAISGLARQLEPKLGKYYAGHWKDHIQGLLWYPADSTGHRPRGTHMPPTWSWASVEGSCIYTEGTMSSILFIVSQMEVNLLSSDPFGMVKGGTIQVSGRIADTTVESHEDDGYVLNGSGRIFDFLPDVRGTPGEEKIEIGQKLQCFLCGYTWLAYFVGWVLKKTPSKRKTY